MPRGGDAWAGQPDGACGWCAHVQYLVVRLRGAWTGVRRAMLAGTDGQCTIVHVSCGRRTCALGAAEPDPAACTRCSLLTGLSTRRQQWSKELRT